MVKEAGFRTVLDYGCGKGTLAKTLPFPIWEYDPAIKNKDWPPRPSELVVCADVLEHIEPECLDAVLDDLASLTLDVAYFVIHTKPAGKDLPDGRNAHLIQEGKDWWERKLFGRFTGLTLETHNELHMVLGKTPQSKWPLCAGIVKSSRNW